MQHGGGIVPGVLARIERILHHRQAQRAVHIGAVHAAVDRVRDIADDMRILPDIEEDHRHAGVLADRDVHLARRRHIVEQAVKHTFGKRAAFAPGSAGNAVGHVLCERIICSDKKFGDRILHRRGGDHTDRLSVVIDRFHLTHPGR